MDAKSHSISPIMLALPCPCLFGLFSEHVHKWKCRFTLGGDARKDIGWEPHVAATGTRPMIIWVAQTEFVVQGRR